MNDLKLKCDCGKVRGVVHNATPKNGNRIACHCNDCQAFAEHLNQSDALDEYGGTDIFQTSFSQVEITEGAEHMRSIRLKPKGLIRWYTDCCKTPIGNTLSAKMPFVGIIHTFIDIDASERDNIIGPIRGHGFLKKDSPGYHLHTPTIKLLPRMIGKMIAWKIKDSKKTNPFFTSEGNPVSEPEVLAVS